MPLYTIRPATLDDAAVLADLGARTFRETFESFYQPEDLHAFLKETYDPPLQARELEDPSRPGLVLELEGVPAGFAQLRLGQGAPGVEARRPVELQRIYLLREAQGGGRGNALLAASEALARGWGADAFWLGVWEHNAKALAFYTRHGFREVGEHHFPIGRQVDRDLILVKELS